MPRRRFRRLEEAGAEFVVDAGGCGVETEAHGEPGLTARASGLSGKRVFEESRPEGLNLRGDLLDVRAGLQAASDEEPEERTIFKVVELACACGDGDLGRCADDHACEPLASDADDSEELAVDANIFVDDAGIATEALLPELVTDDGRPGRFACLERRWAR